MVVQLVERSLQTSGICGLNPVIGKILSNNCTIQSRIDDNKEKEAHLKKGSKNLAKAF